MSVQTAFDPWLKLRDMTSQRNDLIVLADHYDKMGIHAVQLLNELKDRPKASRETLEGLRGIVEFAHLRSKPLWEKVSQLEARMKEESERINHD